MSENTNTESGQFDGEISSQALGISEPEKRSAVQFSEVRTALEQGDIASSLDAIALLERQMDRDLGYGEVAEFISTGTDTEPSITRVVDILNRIENIHVKDDTLVSIATAFEGKGNTDSARIYLVMMEDLDLRDEVATRMGIALEYGVIK